MKKLLQTTTVIITCFLLSCKQSPTSTTNNTQAEKNKAMSEKVNRAIITGDLTGLDSIIDNDVVDHAGPNGEIRGLDSLKKFFTQMHNSVRDLKS